ncbi:YegS/Rv2252/BmrU family lipid kinase [Alkalibacter rhizosphaerae]|uniref:YegS/Rv2252/BmrU family lipid kinase n=1 Tax=Alkalibacter rhizosphaerae TaxID=2815577 RepID=A0A974XN83_9FIRM|nr:YegS/Rv2252/BmrU family lipid kinase [Alkalibacter rhizosphaerae]QSX08986.1 YegS/Rv2252/BmrU family lipid kinase [Alkalibacter rhizosphaerae]
MDKQALLIYNPVSGTKGFAIHLDIFIHFMQVQGYEVHPIRSKGPDDFKAVFHRDNIKDYEAIFIAGGDGSVNMAIHEMLSMGLDIPVGIIPAGTVNDISYNLGIPQDILNAIKSLLNMKLERYDVGVVNGQYFMNSCGAGLFVDVAHTTDRDMKNMLGRVAYYLKGISEMPNFQGMDTLIETPEQTYEETLFLYLVINGQSVGGFRNLALEASMQDGLLDFIGIRECPMSELSIIFAQILMGNYKNNKNILYFKSDRIKIECVGTYCHNVTDVDGERGPSMPLNISMIKGGVQMFVPEKEPEPFDIVDMY